MAVFSLPLSTTEKLSLLQKRTDDFLQYAFLCYIAAVICTNWVVYKTMRFIWLFIAVVFAMFASFTYSGLLEKTFIFKKQNGFWKGEFSLSFFAAIFYSVIAVIVCAINWLLLKKIFKKQRSSKILIPDNLNI